MYKLGNISLSRAGVSQKVLVMLPIHVAILSLVLNDWRLGSVSFSDPLIVIGVLMLVAEIARISKQQILLLLGVLLIIVTNFLMTLIRDNGFMYLDSLLYLLKISMYALFVILTFNYIVRNELAARTLKAIVGWAIVLCGVGVYISFVISTSTNLPYEFFWQFTRQDADSYMFRGSAEIVRTRSVFAEPQHFGLFLNLVLVLALFNSQKFRIKKIYLAIFAFTATLTYSFATIPVTIFIGLIALLRRYNLRLFFKANVWVGVSVFALSILLLWEYVYATIVYRFQQIVDGEDGSAIMRLAESWNYISQESFFIGNGIGATPNIWNNYAYVLSDLGVIPLLLMIFLSIILFKRNPYLGLFFVVFSFQKGGYLSAYYWMLTLFLFVFSLKPVISDDARREMSAKKKFNKSIGT